MSIKVRNCGSCGKPVEDDSDFVKTNSSLMVFHKDALACAEAPELKVAGPFRPKVSTNYSRITYTYIQYSGEGQ